jgi:hypothetical protein
LNLNNGTNQIYAIWGATSLLTGWQVETEVWPTNPAVMPFTVPTLGRQNLFLQAEDWTGVTENGNTTPLWWFWEFFQTLSLSDTSLDRQGNTLLYDYQNGIDPTLPVLAILGGNYQAGNYDSFLPLPVTIEMTDVNTNAVTNAPVVFAVANGTALLAATTNDAPTNTLSFQTDSNGQASVWIYFPPAGSNPADSTIVVSACSGTNTVTTNVNEYVLLAHWTFDDTNTWVGQEGQLPLLANNLAGVPSWSSNAVLVDSASPALLAYNVVETNGSPNINCQTGSVLFYFKPDWSSYDQCCWNRTGPGVSGRLIEMGNYDPAFTNGWWSLYLSPDGTQIFFGTSTNGGGMTNLSASISWASDTWYQIALAYSPTGSALFVDGQMVAAGAGVTYCLNADELAKGFRIGSDQDGNNQAGGAFDELETFASPLSGIGAPADTYWFGIPDYQADPDGTLGAWEMSYFGYLGLDPNGDYDGDGVSNLREFMNGTDPNKIQFSLVVTNHYVNINSAAVQLNINGGVPSSMAVLVNDTNFDDAVWQPFAPVNIFPLGSSDGDYDVWIGLRGRLDTSQQTWAETTITLDTTPPAIVITNPAATTVSQPMIQLQGYSGEPLASLYYDVVNAAGGVTNAEGFVTGQEFDTNAFKYTTNWFQCYDIALTNGVNTITLRATDLAGNTTVTNLSVTLDYSGDTNPPVFAVTWPQDGQQISGEQFTLQGLVDDNTAVITAQIMDESGNTNILAGLVERNGQVWVINLPLAAGTNLLTVSATDAAGNTSTTNLTVYQSTVTVTLNPLVGGQFNQSSVSVTGTVSDATCQVTVNGVQAAVNGDGAWTADGVPVNATGTAIFDVEVYSAGSLSALSKSGHRANDPSDATALGSQIVSQPQPATVELTGFTGKLSDVSWFINLCSIRPQPRLRGTRDEEETLN